MKFTKETINFIENNIGNFTILNDHRKNVDRTGVIEIEASKKRFFVKIHNRLSRWGPEVFAYKNWLHRLEPMVPKLYKDFRNEEIYGIIITPIEGKTVNEYKITDQNKLIKIYYEAGKLFRKLQRSYTN